MATSSTQADTSGKLAKRKSTDNLMNGMEKVPKLQPTEPALEVTARYNTLRKRPWDLTPYGKKYRSQSSHKQRSNRFHLTIVSYNVLAQNLLEDNPYLYRQSAEKFGDDCLTWEKRSRLLLQEILQLKPSILCLQEVNYQHMTTFFHPELQKAGYAGHYVQRTDDKLDGCAIFYVTDMFDCDAVVPVEYRRRGCTLLDRDNVALLLRLTAKGGRSRDKICVANTHLLFNPKRGDVKLAQAMVLLAELERLAYKPDRANSDPHEYYPVLVCGDFNSEPFSDIYNFLGSGRYDYVGRSIREASGQREGRSGRETYFTDRVMPPEAGIADSCVYLQELEQRAAAKPAGGKQKRGKTHRTPDRQMTSSADPAVAQARQAQAAVDGHDVMRMGSMENGGGPFIGCFPFSRMWQPFQAHPIGDATYQQDGASTSRHQGERRSVTPLRDDVTAQNSGRVSHRHRLLSSYRHVTLDSRHREVREVTTHHGLANCTVDYIWYSVASKKSYIKNGRLRHKEIKDGLLTLVSTLRLPSDDVMTEVGPLPNDVVGSDHVMLAARFIWRLK